MVPAKRCELVDGLLPIFSGVHNGSSKKVSSHTTLLRLPFRAVWVLIAYHLFWRRQLVTDLVFSFSLGSLQLPESLLMLLATVLLLRHRAIMNIFLSLFDSVCGGWGGGGKFVASVVIICTLGRAAL